MSALDLIHRRSLAITQRIALAGVVAMLAVALLTVGDVLARWLANRPIHGLNEMVGMGMAVAVAATFPAGAAQRVNLIIDLLQDRIGNHALGWLKAVAALLLLALAWWLLRGH